MPAIYDGSFISEDGAPSSQWAKEVGQTYLRGLATMLCALFERHSEYGGQNATVLHQSLSDDGFQFVGSQLVETNQDIVPEAQEISAVESLIRESTHDAKGSLLHHFVNGRKLYESGPYHASVGEWHSFLEEVLRGIWRATRNHRSEFASFAEKPNMKDLFGFLARCGFLDANESLAFESTWGFLSAGEHPGISEKDDAHLSMILALTFGHAALLKLRSWSERAYRSF